MVKTIRKKITLLSIISMLSLLFVVLAPVMGAELSDLIADEPESAPLLDVTLSPGETTVSTSATVTGHVYGGLIVNITEAEITTPYVGDPAPTAGGNLITGYESGADISAGVAAGNYLQVYAGDMEDSDRIIGFYQARLTEGEIKAADAEEGVEENVKEEEEPAGGLRTFGFVPLSSGEASATEMADFVTDPLTAIALLGGPDRVDYNVGTNEITLKGVDFSTSAPVAVILPDNVTLVLQSDTENGIRSTYAGEVGSSLGIQGTNLAISGEGLLEVSGGSGEELRSSFGIFASSISISGGRVTARGGNAMFDSLGIHAGSSINISGNSSVTVSSGEASDTSEGIYAPVINILGGELNATGGSVAISASNSFEISGGLVTAMGGRIGIWTSSESGSIEISGGTLTAIGGTKALSKAPVLAAYSDYEAVGAKSITGGVPADPEPYNAGSNDEYEYFNIQPQLIIYVNEAATGLANGTSWDNAYTTLQAALAIADSGKQIRVAKGTYYPASVNDLDRYKHFRMKNGVAIYGGFAGDEAEDYDLSDRDFTANETILSGDIGTQGDNCDNSYHVFFHDNLNLDDTAILDGFTITGGNANGDVYLFCDKGGGMYNNDCSPTLTNVTFSGNSADSLGGGMHNNWQSSPTLTNVTFSGNRAEEGGGMQNDSSSPTLTNITFSGNSAGTGGGMQNDCSSPTLTDVIFRENSAEDEGGGMYNWNGNPALTDVEFIVNTASYGGGLSNNYSSPALTNVIFRENSAQNNAGGMYSCDSAPVLTDVTFSNNSAQYNGGGINIVGDASPVLTNVVFTGNSAGKGGAIYNDVGWTAGIDRLIVTNAAFSGNRADKGGGMYNCEGTYLRIPVLTNTTFKENSAVSEGGGMYNTEENCPIIKNSIFWGNSNGQIDGTGEADITYSLILDYTGAGAGNINVDPMFIGIDDLRLQAGSPAIDAGIDEPYELSGVAYGVTTDLDGNPRIANNSVDMGAYEYQLALTVPVTSITVTGTGEADSLQVGNSLQMLANVLPANTTDNSVTWSIEAGSGATLDSSGMLTATATGSVTVRATANDSSGIYGEKVIMITPAPVTTYTVTASAGSGGAISPSGAVSVTSGGNQTFTISPGSGYQINSVTVDGVDQGAVTTFTFTNVTANHTISVAFTSSGGGGDNNSGNSGGNSSPDSNTPASTAQSGVDILINGKTETAATATTSQEEDKTITTIVVDDKKVEERLAQEGNHAVVTIPVNNGAEVVVGTLNGQTVKNMEMTESVLKITTGQVTYTLPASQINIDAVSEQIGRDVALKDIAVSVRISEPLAETIKIVADTANQNNYQIVVPPIEFAITCSSDDKTVEVTKFNAYVERLVAIPEGIDPSRVTTGVIVNPDGTFSHVPTVITVIDGKYYAKINSLTNSTYSVIYSPKVFKDVETHWARDAINDMASRLVVSGVGQDTFEPGRDITRAEFAAIVVRGLGLMRPGVGQDNFDDVIQKNWYYDAVTIAGENGIISGYGYGKFGPDDQITREQAMAMIARAMQVTKLEANLTDSETNKVLAGFTDANRAADYAKPGIAACVKTGLISGRNPNTLAPKDNITRAEVAVIVQRLLQRSGLI